MSRYLNEHGLETLWGDIEQYVGSQTEGTAESDGSAAGPIVELTAKGHAEQASTTGKNLWKLGDKTLTGQSNIVLNPSLSAGTYTISAVVTSDDVDSDKCLVLFKHAGGVTSPFFLLPRGVRASVTYNAPSEITGITFFSSNSSAASIGDMSTWSDIQLELGSTATSYEPYTGGAPSPSPDYPQEIQTVTGHEVTGKTGQYVDLVVKQGDTTLSTTPIPLPERGWVGSLPDGTADILTLDGAGKVVWEEKTEEVVLDGSETWAVRNSGKLVITTVPLNVLPVKDNNQVFNAYCTHFTAGSIAGTWNGNQSIGTDKATQTDRIRVADGSGSMTVESWVAWLAQNPVTVLYPLAAPVTEDMGYIDLPDIPEAASLSIPELDDLGVKYCVDGVASTLANQYYDRAKSEYEDRITALEEAVAEIIAG